MTNSGKVVAFIVAIAVGFVYICRAIPQIESQPMTAETEIGESPEELIAAGKKIFMSDRSQCLTCHSLGEDPKARCPNQEGLGERAATRKEGLSAAEFLVESVYDPNAFIAPGYPANQMTPVNKPPIALSHDQILAVLSYLNSLGGQTDGAFVDALKSAQGPWRKGLKKPGEFEEKERLPVLAGDARQGWEVFQKQSCIQCHRVGKDGRDVGPELTAIGATQTARYLLESMLEPSAVIVKGYRETIVVWKDEDKMDLRGTVVAWLPDKEHPRRLKLAVLENDETKEHGVDLGQVVAVGDVTVGIEFGEDWEDFISICGEYVSGDSENGITLKVLKDGEWVTREMPAEGERIAFANLAMSPMPANLADLLRPREVYDLVAFLSSQKGGKP